MTKPEVIVRIRFPKFGLELLERDFVVHYAPTPDAFEQVVGTHGQNALALVTNGVSGVNADQLARLTKLEIIHTRGVGYEAVHLQSVTERGIVLVTGKGTNAFSVADHAVALMLAIARNIVNAHMVVRTGAWQEAPIPCSIAWRKRLGIVGMGEIGLMIAQRAERGFEMEVCYHNRTPRAGVPYQYKATAIDLARDSDFVILALPGGAKTRHMIDRDFLDAVGPTGFLINVGRGSVLDNAELMQALHEGRLAGAALDVVDGEPRIPKELFDTPNLIITPHLASRSREAEAEAINRVARNLKAYLSGEPLISRIM